MALVVLANACKREPLLDLSNYEDWVGVLNFHLITDINLTINELPSDIKLSDYFDKGIDPNDAAVKIIVHLNKIQYNFTQG